MMVLMKAKKFQQGFAIVPVIILVALVGLMVPTVKYVTDPEASFDNRGFAQVMIDGVVGAIPKKKKTKPKPVVKKDPVTIKDIKEVKEEREEEEEAPPPAPALVQEPTVVVEEKPSKLEELIGMLDQQAQDSIEQEQSGVVPEEKVDLAPPQSEVVEEEPDIGEVDDELFSMLDEQAQQSIIKEVEEEKQAEAYEELASSGYLLEDDKAQYEKENEEPASSADQAAADRWTGYSENQITGQEAYEQAEEDISTYTYTTQSPDVTDEGQAELTEALTYSVGTKVVDGQITTVPVYDQNGTLTYQEALAAIGQVAVSDTYSEGEEVGCATLTGQEREDCFTALSQEAQKEWEEVRNTAVATTVIAGGLYAAPTVIPAAVSELATTASTIWSTASMGSTTGIAGGLQTLAGIPGAVVNYGSAVMSTALSGFTAAELAALGIAGEVAGIVSTGVAAAQCEQGNDVACGMVLDVAAGYQQQVWSQADAAFSETVGDYVDEFIGSLSPTENLQTLYDLYDYDGQRAYRQYIQNYGRPPERMSLVADTDNLYPFQEDLIEAGKGSKINLGSMIEQLGDQGVNVNVLSLDELAYANQLSIEWADAVNKGVDPGFLRRDIPDLVEEAVEAGTRLPTFNSSSCPGGWCANVPSSERTIAERLSGKKLANVYITTPKGYYDMYELTGRSSEGRHLFMQKLGHEAGHGLDWTILGIQDSWATEVRQKYFNSLFYSATGDIGTARGYLDFVNIALQQTTPLIKVHPPNIVKGYESTVLGK